MNGWKGEQFTRNDTYWMSANEDALKTETFTEMDDAAPEHMSIAEKVLRLKTTIMHLNTRS